jgi:integrase
MDVDLEASSVHIRGTKTRASDRRLPLPLWLVERMKGRAERFGEDGLVFSSPHQLNEPGTRATRPRLWPASSRAAASGGPRCIASGVPWRRCLTRRAIADQLGHTDPAMTASNYLGRGLIGDKPSVAEHL